MTSNLVVQYHEPTANWAIDLATTDASISQAVADSQIIQFETEQEAAAAKATNNESKMVNSNLIFMSDQKAEQKDDELLQAATS